MSDEVVNGHHPVPETIGWDGATPYYRCAICGQMLNSDREHVTDAEQFEVPEGEAFDAWRVQRFTTSRGFGRFPGKPETMEDVIGLHLWCYDLDKPGQFVFSTDEAEIVANALLDSVRAQRAENS